MRGNTLNLIIIVKRWMIILYYFPVPLQNLWWPEICPQQLTFWHSHVTMLTILYSMIMWLSVRTGAHGHPHYYRDLRICLHYLRYLLAELHLLTYTSYTKLWRITYSIRHSFQRTQPSMDEVDMKRYHLFPLWNVLFKYRFACSGNIVSWKYWHSHCFANALVY